MNTVIYSVTLKLDEIDDADNTVVMMQSDNLTRIIRAMFYDKDTIEAIDKTAVVQLVIARPDNKVLWVDCHGIDSDEQLDYYNTIESVITADMISVPGNGMGQFLIWNAEKTEVIRSQKFRLRIGKKLDNLDAQEGDPAYGALQEMLDRAVEKYMANNPNIPTKEESGAMRGQSWKEILNITTEEELTNIYFDLTGYTKFYVYAELKPNAAGEGSWFRLYPTGSDMLYTHGADIGKTKRYYSLCFEKIDVFHPVFLYTSTSATAFYENSVALSGGANPRLSEIGEIRIATYKPMGVGSVIKVYAKR